MESETKTPSKTKNFVWTDEETALLLKVVHEYKTTKISSSLDWETVRTKYTDIANSFVQKYPKGKSEEFPHSNDEAAFTEERITAKIRKVKNNFRKALDSGRRSGGGRLVFTLYEDCSAIWSGCPSAESIAGGIETSSINANDMSNIMDPLESDKSLRNSSTGSSTPFEAEDEAFEPQDTDDEDLQPLRKKLKEARASLSDVLKDRRNSESNKHISFHLYKTRCWASQNMIWISRKK